LDNGLIEPLVPTPPACYIRHTTFKHASGVRTDMAKSKLRRRLILILVLFLIVYSAGYVVCRLNKSIVHSAASVDGKCTAHEVHSGDFKMTNMPSLVASFYTPLRYLELGVWKIVKPAGSSC
jgi:hypothetical protein